MAVMSALSAGHYFTQEDSWYSFLLKVEQPRATVWLEGLSELKNRMASSGIKPATFRLVTQCLSPNSYSVLNYSCGLRMKSNSLYWDVLPCSITFC
jgi:hypothetical protein